eukprot:SAG31_NODE_9331_length_1295_cov_1.971572_2_plen_106_part_00
MEQLTDIFDGLAANDLPVGGYDGVLTGYLGSPDIVAAVAKLIRRLREQRPDLMYVCDPVLGDNGRLYVKEAMVGAFKRELLPLADVITPNGFEVSTLSGLPVLLI